jgi:hypothetical protein
MINLLILVCVVLSQTNIQDLAKVESKSALPSEAPFQNLSVE